MKSINSRPSLDRSLDSGWSIHVYNNQRKLLCSFCPSHGWSFAAGTAVGIVLAVMGFNLAPAQMPEPMTGEAAPQTAPLQLD